MKKEYIFDNFKELVDYLHAYPVTGGEVTADYEATLDSMTAIVDDIAAMLASTPLWDDLSDYDGRRPATIVRLMAALLIAEARRGVTRHDVMLTLVGYLMAIRADILELWWRSLWNMVIACMRGREFEKLGIQWADISHADTFSVPMFVCRLAATTFKGSMKQPCHYEHEGLMVVPEGENAAWLAPVNRAVFARGSYASLFEGDSPAAVMVPEADVKPSRETFETLYTEARYVLTALSQFKASPERKLKDYADDDIFPVRVTVKSGIKFIAETVDPAYSSIEGKMLVKWAGGIRPDDDVLRAAFVPGTLVAVRRADPASGYAFDAEPALEDFYRRYACEFADETAMAVYDRDTPEGSLWVTEDGIRVIVHESKLETLSHDDSSAFDEAVEALSPIPLRFYKNAPDINKDKFKVFAQPDFNYADADYTPFTPADADRAFTRVYRDETDAMARDIDLTGADSTEVSPIAVDTLARMMFARPGASSLQPVEALHHTVATAMLCHMAGRSTAFMLMGHRLDVLERLVAFCHNREVRPVGHASQLDGIAEVARAEEIVECLRGYVDPTAPVQSAAIAGPTALISRVSTLVGASNSLRGIIGELELNNIKKNIASSLHVSDEFEPIVSDRTFYGTESISLEFKTTVVFPPENRRRFAGTDADPELQKWAILKCVCGFLNSRSGGELLIGVNDSGYANGIDQDMAALYERRLIASADPDHYRLYVQNIIDHAFREYGATTQSTDITSLNIDYQMETNAEGVTILRIHVRPYSYGVVAFAADLHRPDDYAESYVRRDGRTIRLTPALRAEVGRYKLDAPAEASRGVIMASRAIDERRIIVLRGYTSRSGSRDRTVEPYKVWKKRGVVYGYDADMRQARLFKVSRASGGVELTDRRWTTPRCRVDIDIDDFGMLLMRDSSFAVELRLTDYGRCLLNELTPSAVVTAARGDDAFPWRYRTRVSSPVGVARFAIGLPSDAVVAEGDPVKAEMARMLHQIEAQQ